MIDIHTHILPNVDDGSNSIELSLIMLEEEIKQGVTDVYLTPHVCYGNKQYYEKEELLEKFEKFKEVCKNIPINIHLGEEIFFRRACSIEVKTWSLDSDLPALRPLRFII